MLNEEDKKALKKYGNRRFFWKGRIKRYSQVADELDLESLDKEIKQYDDMRWFSKSFFKKLGLFLFVSISKKRKVLCYSLLNKYLNETNNVRDMFEQTRDILAYHASKLGFFSIFLKQLTNRLLAMKENNISSFEEKPIESISVDKKKSITDVNTEEIIESFDARESQQFSIVYPAFIHADLLNAVSTEVKAEIINFGNFLVESDYRMQNLEIIGEKVDKKIEEADKKIQEADKKIQEADKKIEGLESTIKIQVEQREELKKSLKEEQELRKKEKEDADKRIKDLEENMENKMKNMFMSYMQSQKLPQTNSNMNNNSETSSSPPANNAPGFFK
ncbi:MAG: hypothetical protein LEGION0398_MBIBDBAK_00215 [Legionellaceae bacterium]